MNSIVERLRSIGNNTRRDAAREGVDLIEHQAERIKELEAQLGWPQTAASRDVLLERCRQVSAEGRTPEHDDQYTNEELRMAGGCYALYADDYPNQGYAPTRWPWQPNWWKPKDPRRDLVRAAALIIAEIERLDRAEGKVKP